MKLALILVLAAPLYACHVLEGDRITGKDLAAASPVFAALDPAVVIGPAPLSAVERVLRPEELLRIARANGISSLGLAGAVCFVRASEVLTPEKLLPALRGALGIKDAQIDILDFSRYAVPVGSLEFTRAGLFPDGLWRGHIGFGENRSTPVWARVRITTEQTWIEAAAAIPAGKTIDAAQLKQVKGPRFPLGPAPAASLNSVAGQAASRAIKPGEPIFANMLSAPREVERGDTVTVEVSSGAAHLSLDAVSQSSGRSGDTILIKNPENGRYFQARVSGKDKVSINK